MVTISSHRRPGRQPPISVSFFRNRTVTRIHSHTTQPHRHTAPRPPTTPDFGSCGHSGRSARPHSLTGRPVVTPIYTRRPTGPGRAVPRVSTDRANGTCATSGPCQAPRHQAPACLRKLLQRVYMYTEYRPSRQAEPADEGPAHGPMGTRTQASRLELAIRHLAAILLIEYQAADLSALATA